MEIGTPLSLKRFNIETKEIDDYKSRVIDIDDQFFYIDYPVNKRTNKTDYFYKNEKIIIQYTKNNVVFEFTGTMLERVNKNVPAFKFEIPKKEDLNQIQRRQFVRIETDVDIAVHCPNDSFPPFTTVTQDISGGGASLFVKNQSLEVNQKILIYIVLNTNNEYEYIETEAKVVRFQSDDEVNIVSVKFLIDDENIRQKIIQYCFDIERKNRKLGIL